MRIFSFAREKIRGIRRCDAGALRAWRARRKGGAPFYRVRSLRGDARGIGRPPAVRAPARLACGALRGALFFGAGNKGDRPAQHLPCPAFGRLRVLVRQGEARAFRAARHDGRLERGFIRRHEPCVRRSRNLRNGQRGALSRPRGGDRRARHICGRGLHPERRVPRGRRCVRGGDALSRRRTREPHFFRGGRLRRAHLARLVALPAACGMREVLGRKKIRRGGSRAARGVFALPIRAFGRRARSVSGGRRARRRVLSAVRF